MSLRLHFHGASGAVTGSCFLLESRKARVLVDCGLFQGSKSEKELNYRPFPFTPAKLDAVILTHAHIDHSGLLPKLVKAGYAGPIHATAGTADLCSIMLPDSGYIQEMEVAQLNVRNQRRGRPPVAPIYTADDAAVALTQFRPHVYGEWHDVAPGIRSRFWDAGHLLGSASVEIEVAGDGEPVRLLFSGDIGPDNKLLQHDPEAPRDIDYLVCESTYGDTMREPTAPAARRAQLRDVVREAARTGGALLIPSFAVERTQELLVDLVGLMEQGALPRIPVFIDSPLASRASTVFGQHAAELEEGSALVRALEAPNVRFTENVEQSKAIDHVKSFHIVIAASGMCEAGRIRHHLKARLWRDDTTILFVGFQAQGTLGRILLDGASRVRLMGEDIRVRAKIRSLDLYSGHADAAELVAWVRERGAIRGNVFLVHGEADALEGLRARLNEATPDLPVSIPALDDVYELGGGAATSRRKAPAPRVPPERLGHMDWHNDLSRLILDIGDTLEQAADERQRASLIRRLRRALDEPDRASRRGRDVAD